MNWHNKSKDEVLKELNTDLESGLNSSQVDERIDKYGLNELQEEKRKSFLYKIKDQFSDFLVLILIAAAIVSYFVGETTDAVVIMIIVVLNAFLSIYQEGRAEKGLDALKKMSSPTATVIRNGSILTLSSDQLVPGDIIILETGDIVPADIRLLSTANLKIDESSLTGESVAVEKDAKLIDEEDTALGDRHNLAYMSSIVTYGRGQGVVVATGHDSEIGKIASQLQTESDQLTPLQRKLNELGKTLGLATIVISIIVFSLGLFQGRDPLDMFMISISLAVAAIPEGLPAIVTIVLSLGMARMVERNAIVKKLLAVETLGSTTVICSDKTGTLTQNEMTVSKIFVNDVVIDVTGKGYSPSGDFLLEEEEIKGSDELDLLVHIAGLTNDSSLVQNEDDIYEIIGDPTEGALITLAGKYGLSKDSLNEQYRRLAEIPFDSDRKMMTTFHDNYKKDKLVSFTKGAPDVVLRKSSHILLDGEILALTDSMKEAIMKANNSFSQLTLRVLAYAYKDYDELPATISSEVAEDKMIFVGLTGMVDPAREEAKIAIAKCHEAGISTVMITGDYKETAFAIAKELNITQNPDEVIMGRELDNLTDKELKNLVNDIHVFARVSPEHKVRIVSALKANGHIVAMTGDGVNDAPALKRADIGVAMGITGTDVAKNTAEMILTDDNFASIVAAVEEGRIIYDNILKFVSFLLSCNIGEILIISISVLFKLPIPLIPIQLLWLNLVTDSFPALALGVEEGDPDIMGRKPKDPAESLLSKELISNVMLQSITIAFSSLAVYIFALNYYDNDILTARALVFTTLIMSELLRAYSSRSYNYTIFELGVFSNKSLVYGTSFSFVLLLGVLYIPFLQPVFDTIPLNMAQWALVLFFAMIPLLVGELGKKFRRSR